MQHNPNPLDAPPEEFGLRDLLLIARRQRRLILGGALVGLAGGVVALQRIQPTYEASTSIRIDEAAVGVPELSLIGGLPTGNQIGTDMEVIRSRALADAVVDSLGLQVTVAEPREVPRSRVLARVRVAPGADTAGIRLVRSGDRFQVQPTGAPGSAPAEVAVGTPFRVGEAEVVLAPGALEHPAIALHVISRVQAREALHGLIEVERPSRDANIIRVRARGVDPALVSEIPNALAAGFVAHRQSIQKARARSTADFLRQQLDTLAVQLSAAEERLRAFRESGQVINLQVEGSTQVQRLAEMQAERATLESERTALAQLVAEVARESRSDLRPGDPSPYRRLLAFPSLLRNQSAAELLRSLTNLEDERASLLTRRSAKDPDVMVLSERIRSLEGQLQDIITTYLAGLSNQIGAMDGSLATFESRLDRIPERELQFARLARQTQVLEEIYGQLQTRLKEAEVAQAVEDPSIRIVDTAVAPTSPASPSGALIVGFALMLGLIAGTGGGFLREYLDGTVRTRGDALYATGVPVLGMVPRISLQRPDADWKNRVLRPAWKRLRPVAAVYGGVALSKWDAVTSFRSTPLPRPAPEEPVDAEIVEVEEQHPRTEPAAAVVVRPDSVASVLLARSHVPSPLVDAYDRLHSNILFSAPDTEFRTLLLTSALPGDGKTTNAINLALSLAQKGLKVLLIDADMRRGTVAGHFNARRSPGLAEVLTGTSEVPPCLQQIDLGNDCSLDFLGSGAFPPNPAQLLGSDRMASMLEYLSTVYDKIVLDSPPLNIVVDAAMLARHVDGVVLVARTGVTPFEALAYAAEQFRAAQMPVIGVVLNDIDFQRDAAYDSAYQWYGYGEAYYSSAR